MYRDGTFSPEIYTGKKSNLCTICDEEGTRDVGLIQCVKCKHLHHPACAEVNVERLTADERKDWLCKECGEIVSNDDDRRQANTVVNAPTEADADIVDDAPTADNSAFEAPTVENSVVI